LDGLGKKKRDCVYYSVTPRRYYTVQGLRLFFRGKSPRAAVSQPKTPWAAPGIEAEILFFLGQEKKIEAESPVFAAQPQKGAQKYQPSQAWEKRSSASEYRVVCPSPDFARSVK
jgi:hypothetical protein